ncbi:hypothetical protein LQ318_10040 [Aliifodinibius salicampi]|uniref:Uncharacterized protein n=1 Tax=Fodinibius salicampi TaxID=1920655 RepID=A0ABT3PZF5_9BACT|nr:hypothetical protein [Fodinibius salicampi]MCW9713245.1 hypothetical protein [Fodinibius salicampi]
MKVINKTYRYLSALTLILFLNSIVLPVGLTASSLFCDMEMEANHGGAHTCLGMHSSAQSDNTLFSDNELCNYQQICKEVLSLKENEIKAIPQVAKAFTAVLGYTDPFAQISVYSEINPSLSELNTASTTPPIFLLNSAFLN